MSINKKGKSNPLSAEFHTAIGMNMIELMVVVLIIGVLASLIFPSFQQQILEARRGDGITQLLRLKIQQEAFRIENISYAKTEQLGLPTSEYYAFVVTDVSASTYNITATAIGSQTADKKCLVLQIDQSLNKNPSHCFF